MPSDANEESVIPQRGRSTVAKRLVSSSPSLSRPRSNTKPHDTVSTEETPVTLQTSSPSGSRHAFESRTASEVPPQDASSNPTIDTSQSNELTTRGRSQTTKPAGTATVPSPENQAATTPQGTQANEAPSETSDPSQPQPPSTEAAAPNGPLNRQVQEVAELLFMSSTLDACFEMPSQFSSTSGSDGLVLAAPEQDAEGNPDELEDSEERDSGAVAGPDDEDSEELEDDEEDDVDLDFEFLKNAPLIMQRFHAHGEVSERVEAEALKLALHGTASRTSTGARRNELDAGVRDDEKDERDGVNDEHKAEDEDDAEKDEDEDALLQVYYDMLDNLDKLHAEALELEQSIIELTKTSLSLPSDAPPSSESDGHDRAENDSANENSTTQQKQSPRSQIIGIIAACLPVIRARKSNLLMAQELIDSALENLSITLRMENMGLE